MTERFIDNCLGQDIFCEQLARIDCLGNNRRLIFTTRDMTEPDYQVVVAKLIIPADFLVTLAYMAAGADARTVSRELLALEPRIAN
jgi:hypothetical protein